MKQTLIAIVEDKPGVLNRITSLFRRRNFNIDSLVVGRTENPGISRMTIVANETDSSKRINIYLNLLKLINVIAVKDVSELPCIEREYILIKVHINPENLNNINEIAKKYGARIVDMGKRSAIIEATENKEIISELIEKLSIFKIVEMMRTGKMAMQRGIKQNTAKVNNLQINDRIQNQDDILWATQKINAYLK